MRGAGHGVQFAPPPGLGGPPGAPSLPGSLFGPAIDLAGLQDKPWKCTLGSEAFLCVYASGARV
eukprot:9183783-Pyramimonas_sp.AAC.1